MTLAAIRGGLLKISGQAAEFPNSRSGISNDVDVDVDDLSLALDATIDDDCGRTARHAAMLAINIRSNHQIGGAGFILDRAKNNPMGR